MPCVPTNVAPDTPYLYSPFVFPQRAIWVLPLSSSPNPEFKLTDSIPCVQLLNS